MKKAFTLIELLVVIAIIGILAAILFPVFARAKEAARKVQSISNLKQITLAWNMYNTDSDGTIMRASTQGADRTYYWWGSWDGTRFREQEGLLFPYTKNRGISKDPSFPNQLRTVLGETGYGYNYHYLSPSEYPGPTYEEIPIPVNESQIERPAETLNFASAARINNWSSSAAFLEGSTFIDPPSNDFPGFHGRHSEMGVIAWCDGHAKAKKPALRTANFGYGFIAEDFRKNNLGDVIAPDCPTGSACQDFLYELAKTK